MSVVGLLMEYATLCIRRIVDEYEVRGAYYLHQLIVCGCYIETGELVCAVVSAIFYK